MTIKEIPSGTSYHVRATACPLCGDDLPEQVGMANHIRSGECSEVPNGD